MFNLYNHAPGSGRGVNALVNGWRISGTLFAHSGFPYTVQDTQAQATLARENFGGPLYATFPGGPTASCSSPSQPCLSASQLQPSTYNPRISASRDENMFRGPGYFDTDFAFSSPTSIYGAGLGADASPRLIQLHAELSF